MLLKASKVPPCTSLHGLCASLTDICGLLIESFIFVPPADGMGESRAEWEEDEQRLLLQLQEEQHRARINSKASRQHLAWRFGVHSDRCAPLPPLLRLPAEVLCHVLLSVYADATGLASLFWTCRSFALAVLSADAFQGTTASEEQCLHVARLMNLPIRESPSPDLFIMGLPVRPNHRYCSVAPLRSIPIPQWLHTKLRRPSVWPAPRTRLTDVAPVAWRPLLDTLLALPEPPLSQAELAQTLEALHICIHKGMGVGVVGSNFHIEAALVPLQEFLLGTRCARSHGGCCMGKVFSLFGFECPLFALYNVTCSLHGVQICEGSCMVDPNMGDICAKAASITSMHDNCLYVKITRVTMGERRQVLLFLLVSIPWTLGEPHAVVYQAVIEVAMA